MEIAAVETRIAFHNTAGRKGPLIMKVNGAVWPATRHGESSERRHAWARVSARARRWPLGPGAADGGTLDSFAEPLR